MVVMVSVLVSFLIFLFFSFWKAPSPSAVGVRNFQERIIDGIKNRDLSDEDLELIESLTEDDIRFLRGVVGR
jgi:hypothetical protein